MPLKKETVRVTLKAADAPAIPSSTVPVPAPTKPPVPGGPPRPTAPPTATAPAAAPRPTAAPAPTIALKTAGGAPAAAAPAPTIKLATSAAPIGGTPTLPKATVQLQPPTQAIGSAGGPSAPSQAGTLQMSDDDDEGGEGSETAANVMAGVALAAAILLLIFQVMLAGTWVNVEDNPRSGDWSQLLD